MRACLPLLLSGWIGCTSAPGPSSAAPTAPEASTAPAASGVMDGSPGRRTLSPRGRWEAIVAEGGTLDLRPAGHVGAEVRVDTDVDARLAVSPDDRFVVYSRRGPLVETDLWRVDLPGGVPIALTDWPGSEDRPVISPDGRRLAFVSGITGVASWWVVDLDGALPVPPEDARQLTNVGVESAPRKPGHPPAGFVPVPDGTVYTWTADGLSWVAAGQAYTAPVAERAVR
jgi:hypothetical protein